MSVVEQAGPVLRSNQLDFDEETVYEAERHIHDLARSVDERPFCLVVSMTHPHDPYSTLPEFWDLYRDDEIPLPRVRIDDDDQDPHSRRLQQVVALRAQEIDEAMIRRARRGYYGSCSYVDDRMGRLLTLMRRTGLDQNTITIVLGDHGDMLGERDLWFKMSWFEDSVRVPLMVHAPWTFAPRRVSEAVSLIDLLPTLCEIAGDGAAPDYATPIEGRSLIPHLSGSGGHDEVFGEYMGEGSLAPLLMIRRDRWKFVTSSPDPDQLFDLAADPLERTNLTADPDHADVLAVFRREAAERWDAERIREQALASQRRRRLVHSALMSGRHQSWDWQPRRAAESAYMRNHRDLDDVEASARLEPTDRNE